MKRAAIYARVSDEKLELENQLRDLRAWAPRLEYQLLAAPFVDELSGARADRPGLQAALAAAHRREFDVLLVWALDRLSREGIAPMLTYLQRFTAAGVRIQSFREPWLDSESPMWELIVAILAWAAKQERARTLERIHAGLRRARAHGTRSGKPIGRPRVHLVDVARVQELLRGRLSVRAIARELGVDKSAVARALARVGQTPAENGSRNPSKSGPPRAAARGGAKQVVSRQAARPSRARG
jgi:DNA invertase Pin-like site-specific DNA recombinase